MEQARHDRDDTGVGIKYLSFIVKIKANLEAPSDPCYIWDPVTERYIIDHSNPNCSCGNPPGDGNSPGGGGLGGQ